MKKLLFVLLALLIVGQAYSQFPQPPRHYLVNAENYFTSPETSAWSSIRGTYNYLLQVYAADSFNVTIRAQLSNDSTMGASDSSAWVSRWIVGDSTNAPYNDGWWKAYNFPVDSILGANRIRFVLTKKTTKNTALSTNARYSIWLLRKEE